MKDSTRTAMMDGAKGLITLFVIGTILVMASTGCAVHDHQDTAKVKPANNWRPNARCKTIGKARTTHAAVLVQKDCFKAGVTTVAILILNPENNGTVAGRHARKAVKRILGYPPTLGVLVASKKPVPFLLTVVQGRTPETVARK